MPNHGVYVSERETSVTAPVVAASGIPFVVGIAPVHTADDPATANVPVLCTSWDEYVSHLGYAEDWETYTLCEAAYSHFVLYGMQPAIFLNLYDPTTMKTTKEADDYPVVDHKVNLGSKAINNATLVVKNAESDITKDTDFTVYFSNGEMIIELLSSGSAYGAASLNITYDEVNTSSISNSVVAMAMEKVELCMTLLGMVPDMLLAPGFSDKSEVAAAMAAKAANINGLFRAKALVDIPTDRENGATTYDTVVAKKNSLAMTDKDMIVCWPMFGLGGKKYHVSTQLAGLIVRPIAARPITLFVQTL